MKGSGLRVSYVIVGYFVELQNIRGEGKTSRISQQGTKFRVECSGVSFVGQGLVSSVF